MSIAGPAGRLSDWPTYSVTLMAIELYYPRLAGRVIRTWVAFKSSMIAMVAWTGTGLLATHKIAEPVLGSLARDPESE